MLTVEQALQLPSFAKARVVAGHAGLGRPITWVHNVGVPDAAQWFNGGELALTTVMNMPEGEDARRSYIHQLAEKGVVGLVVAVGRMLPQVPAYMIEAADSHDFPLIEVPVESRYVDMAREANEHIVQQNMSLVRRALRIQQTLTQLVLEGGGLRQLAATLAELVNQSISIENERFEALANVNIGAVDEARRYTQQFGHTDPRLVNALESEVLPVIRRTLRPVFIPQMPEVGLEMERILAPIVVQGEIYGYMWLIADDRPLSDLDRMAIESGATVAALMILYQDSVQSAEVSLKGNLLARLVQGELSGRNVLTDQALRYGVDLRQPFRVLMVDYPNVEARHLLSLYRRINRVIEAEDYKALTGQFAGQVLVLAQEDSDVATLAARIHNQAGEDGHVRIGISASTVSARRVKDAYVQCREVLRITRTLGDTDERTVWFDHLGYLHALYHAGPAALEGNPYVPALRLLMQEQGADLFNTLEAYLDAGGNAVRTAHLLNIHRSTLNYRLQRIMELTEMDLGDPRTRLNLQIALKLLRLFLEE